MNLEDRKSLGRQLSKARRAKGYSQTEFAEFLEIERPHLSKYENGHVANPTFDILLKAAQKLETYFMVGGYRLGKETAGSKRRADAPAEKQLTFTFYKDRTFRQAAVRVTNLKKRIVITASVAGAAEPVRTSGRSGVRKVKIG
jgi:transcriptional regulator with XRE-family HTH domain